VRLRNPHKANLQTLVRILVRQKYFIFILFFFWFQDDFAFQLLPVTKDTSLNSVLDKNSSFKTKKLFGKEITRIHDGQNRLVYKSKKKQLGSDSYKITYFKKRYNSDNKLISYTRSKEIVIAQTRFIKKKKNIEYFNNGKLQSKKIIRNKETSIHKKMRRNHKRKRKEDKLIAR
jgi:hypothetical protein